MTDSEVMQGQQVTKNGVTVTLAPGPICKRCGHEPCPFCQTWCDTCIEEDAPCNDGECDFDADQLKAWLLDNEKRLATAKR